MDEIVVDEAGVLTKADWNRLHEIVKLKANRGAEFFVAQPNQGVGADRSVILCKRKDESKWFQIHKVWGSNHKNRANAVVSFLKGRLRPN